MMTTSKRERKEREKNREINAVREREKKKCCGNYGIQLGIRLMVCQGSVTEKEDLVNYDITRKCMSHRDTAYLKI